MLKLLILLNSLYFLAQCYVDIKVLDQLHEDIENQSRNCPTCNYEKRIQQILQDDQIKNDKKNLAKILLMYGKIQFYDLTETPSSYKKAYYFFKMAQRYGNRDALFYLALFQNFQLDGSFNALAWLEESKIDLNITENTKNSLQQYLNDKRFSDPLISLNFANLQGHSEAKIALGYKHYRGIGVPQNCTTAALLYEYICNQIHLDSDYIPLEQHRRRLDKDFYNLNQGIFEINFWGDKLEVLENLQLEHSDTQDTNELYKLAVYYYYGLGGLKRNFQKSFQILYKLNEGHNQSHIQSLLAQMYLYGQGTEKNYNEAKKLFLKSHQTQAQSKNGLGYLFQHGYGTEKNLTKSILYYKEAAKEEDPDGMYNYGMLLLQPSTEEIQRNFDVAQNLLLKAAESGHAKAQYALALIYLDGVDIFQNCEISVQLLKQSAGYGPWADHLKNGDYFYSQKYFKSALSNFLRSAMLGEEIGMLNAGIIADKFIPLTEEECDYSTLQQALDEDLVYNYLKSNKVLSYVNLHYFLFNDYLKHLETVSDIDSRYKVLKKLLTLPPDTNRTINRYISFKTSSLTYSDFPYSSLKLGDHYYYGTYESLNYTSAQDYYLTTTQMAQNDTIAAQGYYNLGYMYMYGQGKQRNLTKSQQYFEKSVYLNPTLAPYAFILKRIVQLELYLQSKTFKDLFKFMISQLFLDVTQQQMKYSVVSILVVIFFSVYVFKVRIKNKKKVIDSLGDSYDPNLHDF